MWLWFILFYIWILNTKKDITLTVCLFCEYWLLLLIFVQVHFAEDLTTVYEVENLGTYFRDRDRFKRRVELAEPTLTPVFDASHRRKMFQRNLQLQTSTCLWHFIPVLIETYVSLFIIITLVNKSQNVLLLVHVQCKRSINLSLITKCPVFKWVLLWILNTTLDFLF